MGNGTGIASVHFGPNWIKIHTTWTKMRRSNVEQQHVANVYKLGVVDKALLAVLAATFVVQCTTA